MDNSIIIDACTQFKNKWGIYPSIFFVNNTIPTESTDLPIAVYHIVTCISPEIIQSVTLNLSNPYIDQVVIVTNNLDVKTIFNNKKITFLEFHKFYGITIDDIFNTFDEKTVNVLLFDNIVFEYNKTINVRVVSADIIGIISSNTFEKEIPNSIDMFGIYSAEPKHLDINGVITLGKPVGSFNYYTHIHGFQNLTIQKFYDKYDVISITKILPSFLFYKNIQPESQDSYITKNFNIKYPIIFVNSKFDNITDDKLNIIYNDLLNELSLSPVECVSYSSIDVNSLPLQSQIDIHTFEFCIKKKLYMEYKSKYDTLLKQNALLLNRRARGIFHTR